MMNLKKCIKELLELTEEIPERKPNVVVMPDFFLDRLVTFKGELRNLIEAMMEVAKRKGGSIHGVEQMEIRGGNAANTASALANLGANVYPIITTNKLGLHILRFYLEPLGVDLSHVKLDEEAAFTTAFEVSYHGEKVNVMISNVGSLAKFGPNKLSKEDYKLMDRADYVCVFHWTSTPLGTELAKEVFTYVKRSGRCKAYYDTSDPSPRKEHIKELVDEVLLRNIIDIFSVNENEAFYYASQLEEDIIKLKGEFVAEECARVLAEKLSARIDLHTTSFAGSFTKRREVIVPAFKVPVLRVTGAGDAWNAGNIFGDFLNLPEHCRLTLANAVAAYYISSPEGRHPTLEEVRDFCMKQLNENF